MNAPALLLFDLDGVLVRYDRATRVQALAERCGVSMQEVAQALFGSGLEDAADRGQLDTRRYLGALSELLGTPVTVEDCVHARAQSMHAEAAVLDLARRAGRHCRLAIFSNNGSLLREQLRAMCPSLFPLFDDRVRVSADLRACKPEPDAFRRCLESLEVDAGDTLFIDDNAGNVHGARMAGLRVHHYRGISELRDTLNHFALLEPDHAP
ncbi:MAG TPA: HAD family phosphatase [Arenimonas sp.]|nr:HAD family phosphatase [Arenimonas sp.]